MVDGCRRILIYGVTGSGKTTLAERLSQVSGLPWTSVDDLTWLPGWVMVTDDRQTEIFREICAREEWILDTAYAKWVEFPLARAELIVALDYPRWISFGRLLRRTLMRVTDGKLICNGNQENWRQMLSRDSILAWHFRSFRRKHERIGRWADDPNMKVIRFTHPRQTDAWLKSLTP